MENGVPRHIAIIMDGNGRWAKQRHIPRALGHRAGVEAMRAVIKRCNALGVEALSVYAFSTENWNRSADEVNALMGLLLEYFTKEIDELHREHVAIRILGDVDGMPPRQRQALRDAMALTGQNTGLKLNIALNYGGRAELVRAARLLAERAARGEISPDAINDAAFEGALYTAGLPDVDLLIRTSGEQRISNFLPWQLSYAEFVFDPVFWPDFTAERLDAAIAEFNHRQRRFGGR